MPIYESRGKKYNIPDDKVNDFTSKRSDAKLIKDLAIAPAQTLDLSQIEGETATAGERRVHKEQQKYIDFADGPSFFGTKPYGVTTSPAGVVPLNAAQMQRGEGTTYEGKNKWGTWYGDIAEKLGGGIVGLGAGLETIREEVKKNPVGRVMQYSINPAEAIRDVGEHIVEKVTGSKVPSAAEIHDFARELKERGDFGGNIIDEETGQVRKKTYSDQWKEGNYGAAIGDIMLTGIESAPTSVAAMLPGGLALVSVSAAGQKYNQLNSDSETKDIPEWKKWLNASTTGALEGLTEKLGAKVDAKMIEPFLSKMTEKTVKQILAKGGVNALIQTITEGGEEVLSQLGENAIDAATGISDTYRPFEGIQDAFVYGAGGGAQFGGVTLGASGVRAGQMANQRRSVRNNFDSASKNLSDNLKEEAPEIKTYIDDFLMKEDISTGEDFIQKVLDDGELTDQQKRSILTYTASANKVFQNSKDRKQKTEQAVSNITQAVDSELNASTGTLMTVTLGDGDNATDIQVKKGNIVQNEDGSINRDQSDKEIYYTDENGNTQVATIDLIGSVVENVSRDEAIIQIASPVIESVQNESLNEDALASQDFNEGDIIYYRNPDTGAAVDVVLQDVNESGMYVGTDASGSQIEVEPRLVQSEQEYLSSMSVEEIEQSIDAINQGLSAGVLSGNMSERALDQRAKLENELNNRAQNVNQNGAENIKSEGAPPSEQKQVSQKSANEQQNVNAETIQTETVSPTVEADQSVQSEGETISNPDALMRQMEENAEPAPVLELTPENWYAEFGEDGMVSTPIGEVKMGENQYLKLQTRDRGAQFGMIKPTLENPDVVLEEESRNTSDADRGTNLLFIKTFDGGDGKKYTHFESVTVSRDKKEVVVSNHIIRSKQLLDKLKAGRVVYNSTALDASGQTSAEYTSPTESGAPYSDSKDNTQIPGMQENAQENTQDPFSDFPRDKKGDIDFDNLNAEQQLRYAEVSSGEDFAVQQATRSIKGLEKKRATLEKKLESETNIAKAANIQKEIDQINNSIGIYKDYQEARNYRESNEERSVSFADRLRNLPEPVSIEDAIAQWIASGGKIKWSDNIENGAITSRGFGNHLGYSNAERRNFLGITSNDGMTPEQLTHYIYENPDFAPYTQGMDTQDILNTVLDIIPQINTRKAALEYSEAIRQDQQNDLAEQQQAFEESRISDTQESDTGSGSFVGVPPSDIESTNELFPFQQTNQRFKSISERKLNGLVERLKTTGLAKDVITLEKAEFIAEAERLSGQPMRTNGVVYGFVTPDGVIYLNKGVMNANTPIHEFGHLWNSFIKENNPELYARGVELIKQSEYWQKVNDNPAYQGLSDEAKADEALAMAVGDKGEQIENRSLKKQFTDWLSDLWNSIKEVFGIYEQVDIQDLTLEQFADMAAGQLLSGENITQSIDDTENNNNFARNENNEVSDRSTSEESRGLHEDDIRTSLASRLEENARRNPSELSRREREESEKRITLDYAKENNLWIDDLYSLGSPMQGGGIENTLAIDPENGVVYKSNNLMNSGMLVSNLLEQVQAHNELFPSAAYDIIGFTGIDNGSKRVPYIEVILGQNYIPDSRMASHEEIDNYMQSLGFEKINASTFKNDRYIVSDLHPRNILVDEVGNIHVIDDIVRPNAENQISKQEISEMEQIKEASIADGAFMKAPNGEGTNLNERQWLQVRTTNFKNWFGDWLNDLENASKVVDENGEPMVVYHGTNQDFYAFSRERLGKNTSAASSVDFFFTEDMREAGEYASLAARTQVRNAVEVERKSEDLLKRIKQAESKQNWDLSERLTIELEELELGAIYDKEGGHRIIDAYLNIRNPKVVDMNGSFDGYRVLDNINEAKESGNDGLLLQDVYDVVSEREEGFTTSQWVLFDPTQIKSATENIGEFSQNDKDIRYQNERNENAENANHTTISPSEILARNNGDVLAVAREIVKQNEVREAESQTNTNPSEAQKEAGNYKKGHVNINGFNVSIEQPKGSVRSGVDKNGNAWEQVMNNTYGYIRGTESRDGDHIDVFLGDNLNSEKIFVVDQVSPERLDFDEHKVMMGFDNIEDARDAYLSNYEDGWMGMGDIAETDIDTFKKWSMSDGRRTKPFVGYGENGINFQIDAESGLMNDRIPPVVTEEGLAEFGNNPTTEVDRDIVDDGIRFQIEPYNESDREIARQNINEKMHNTLYKFRENWEDSQLPVKTFFDELRKLGVRISSANDFYQNVTAVPGKNDFELTSFQENFGKKMLNSIFNIMDIGRSYRDIENYAILKHGLERNDYMRKAEIEDYRQALLAKIPENIKDWKKSHPKATEEDIKKREIKEKLWVNNKVSKKAESIKNKDYAGVKTVEKEVGMSAQEYINSFENTVKEKGSDLIDSLWRDVRSANDFSINKLLVGGVISEKTAKDMKERYKNYIPLRGHDEKTAEDLYDYTSMMGTYFSSPIKKAHGRKSRADDPFAYIFQMAQSAINTSNLNMLKQGVLRIAKYQDTQGLMSADNTWYMNNGQTDENGRTIWEAQYPEYSPDPSQYEKNIEDFNVRMNDLKAQGLARQSNAKFDIGGLFIKRPQKMEHEVTVFENGKEHTVYINAAPDVARAINGANKIIPSSLSRNIGTLTRWMAANMTSRNPAFMATNFSRDMLYALSTLPVKESAEYTTGFVKNIPHATATLSKYLTGKGNPSGNKYDQYAYEFFANGGKTGFTHILELEKTKRGINKDLKRLGRNNVWNGALKAGDGLLEVLQIGNDIAENISRMSAYITSREMGRDIHRSISDAKEITVNFNRSGAGGMFAASIRPLYLFMNAAIQGIANFAKIAVKHPKAASTMLSVYAFSGVLQPLMMGLLGDDKEEEYWRLPEHIRRNNLILPAYNGFITIPLPQELRIFHGLGESAYMAMTGKKDVSSSLVDGIGMLSDIVPLNPMGAQQSGWVNFMPDLAKPGLQAETNKSWTGAPIYNKWANESAPGYQKVRTNKKGEPYSPEWLINFTKGLDHLTGGDGTKAGEVSLNPDKLNHYLKGYVGGLYTLVAQSVDIASKASGEKDVRSKDIPFWNRFYSSPDDLRILPDYIEEKYYEARDEVKEAARQLKDYEKRQLDQEEKMDPLKLAKKISDRWSVVQNFDERQKEIEKADKGLKNLSGEDQKEEETRIAELKAQLVKDYEEFKKK
ncbi:MAG: hypothetical protein LBV72_00615 [Tannerella sp.]|jgi:hypothetical protein|nr:hypothetical protein [Tannerella sp.]